MPAPRDQGVPVNVLQSFTMQYLGAAPLAAGTMIGYDGLVATGAAPIFGVLREDAVQNRHVSVAVAGMVEIISGPGFLLPGNMVGANATGQGIAVGAGSNSIGRIPPAGGTTLTGARVQMLITREGTN
jgi:hypothetical protein